MKKLVVTLLLLFVPVFVQAAEIDEATLKAATRYVESQNIKKVLKDMFNSATQMMPESEAKEFHAKFYERLNYKRIEQACILAAARNFNLEELEAMNEFFATPVGQSILKKQGQYSAEVGMVMQQEVMSTMGKLMRELKGKKKDTTM